MILNVCIDESGTHGQSPFMVMGGIAARPDQWAVYNQKWNRLLTNNCLEYFHSKLLRSSGGAFQGWSDFSKRKLITEIDRLQNRHSLFRFVTVLQKDQYQSLYKSGEQPKKFQLDSMYGLSFRCSLAFVVELAQRSIDSDDLKINFTIESGHSNSGACPAIVSQLKKHVPEMARVLGECVIEDKKALPGLQGADAVSYAGYQQEKSGDTSELMDFEPTWNLDNAKNVLNAKSPVFRSDVKPEILTEMKANLFKFEQLRREFGQKSSDGARR
jgi:hypothetical protein